MKAEKRCAWCLWECDCGRPVCQQGEMLLLPGLSVPLCSICALQRAETIKRTSGSEAAAKELGLI